MITCVDFRFPSVNVSQQVTVETEHALFAYKVSSGDANKVKEEVLRNRHNMEVVNPSFEYYTRPPKEQLFYHHLATIATVFGLGSNQWWGLPPTHKFFVLQGKFFVVLAPLCLLLQVLYMYIHYNHLSFRTLGTMFSIVPATAVVVVKVFAGLIPAYEKIMKDLMDKIHIYNFLDDDEFIKTKLIRVERHTRWIAASLIIFIIFDWMLWIFVPIMNNLKNKDQIANRTIRMETCLYMWMPFDYDYDYQTWMITHALNVYLVGTGGLVMAIYDSVNFIFIFHFMSHIDILKHKINTFFAGELDDTETKERVVSVIKYHSFVLRTFKDMQAAFGVNVALNYVHNLIVDSLLLYQIMVGDKSNRLTYIIMMQFHMGGLILMSLALEQIRMKTDDLPWVLYKIPWERMATSNQKLLIPIIQRMQTPLVFKASGGLRAGVRPLASILKSTFSYYVMLKSSIE